MGEPRHIISLDVGTKAAGSGWLAIETTADEHHPVNAENTRVMWARMDTNSRMLLQLANTNPVPLPEFVFEGMSSYGKAIGGDVMTSLLWIGRMIGTIEARRELGDPDPQIVLRRVVTAHLVGARRKGDPTMDSSIKKAVSERFGGFGATWRTVTGKKSSQGPCYGFKDDIWAAAAVAIAFVEGAEVETGWR